MKNAFLLLTVVCLLSLSVITWALIDGTKLYIQGVPLLIIYLWMMTIALISMGFYVILDKIKDK